MKLDRLIGILSILMQREKVTAPYLAETFEVSRRTISRDIEALCRAGVPIETRQGPGGGLSLLRPGGRVGAGHRALLYPVPLGQLVRVGVLPNAGGLQAI